MNFTSPADARVYLFDQVQSESLRKHCLTVGQVMRWFATEYWKLVEAEANTWEVCGILHDADYEKHPTTDPVSGHPFVGVAALKALGCPQEILDAILGHVTYANTARITPMAKTLFAVDELSGFVTACTLVRPDKSVASLEVSSVTKKLKNKEFAKGCNREDMLLGAQEMGKELPALIELVISAMRAAC